MSRGAVLVELAAGMSAVAILSASLVLQLPQQAGITAGDAIQGGFSLVVMGMVWLVYRRQDASEKRDAEGRKALHDRVDKLLAELGERAREEGERYGRLVERSDITREDIIGMSNRIDGIGSKISNQVEKALESRADETDRRFSALERRMDQMLTGGGRA